MDNKELKVYANKTGGVVAKSMRPDYTHLVTLDKVKWSHNTYVFVFNVIVKGTGFSSKAIITLNNIITALSKSNSAKANSKVALDMCKKLKLMVEKS